MGLLSWLSKSDPKPSDRGEYELVSNANDVAERESGLAMVQTTGIVAGPSSRKDMDSLEGDEPTEEEKKSLRRVPDDLPWSTFLVAIVELCERFTYYGLSGPFQNYISNSYHDPNGLPGAIGLNQHNATALTNFFQFWCYVTPVLGAIIADQYLGKYWTIYYSAVIYVLGVLVLFLTSLPMAIERGFALGGLIAAMIIIGIGTGGIKSNVSPMIAEQYRMVKPFVGTLKSGERVIVDPATTISRIYMIFYMCINFGSLSSLATTVMELHTGFWSAYLLCLGTFVSGFAVLIMGKKHYLLRAPKGSVIPHAIRICWIGLTQRTLDAAKPEYLDRGTNRHGASMPWDGVFVEEVRRALTACKVFLIFPIYWMVYGQMINNFVSQAGQMQLHGIPNDIMGNIDPITIIVFIPIVDAFFYPLLRKFGTPFKPITRIFWGFMLAAAAMAYAAFVQKLIYSSRPCFDAPLACADALQADGTYAPNNIHIAVQAPAYILVAMSEIFASITGLEYAFTKAPPSMKSFIMSMFLLTNAFGAALGVALSPAAVDPTILRMYIGLAVACFIAGWVFWACFRKLNDSEDAMNELKQFGDQPLPAEEVATAIGRTAEKP